jgi:hypothetical protein
VALESDSNAALACALEGAPIWDFEIAGFRRGDLSLLGKGNDNGLFLLHPYMADLIPVVFVHGTASSPALWAEMANELVGDPNIAVASPVMVLHLQQRKSYRVVRDKVA